MKRIPVIVCVASTPAACHLTPYRKSGMLGTMDKKLRPFCGECGSRMAERIGIIGVFWGCPKEVFHDMVYLRPITDEERPFNPLTGERQK